MTKLTGPSSMLGWPSGSMNMIACSPRRVVALHADAGQPDEHHVRAQVPAAAATAELIVS